MSFSVSEAPEWVLQYRNIWNEIESQLFEKLATGPIKGEGKYVQGKLKTWKDRIKANFHGQDVSYDMYCNVTAMLKSTLSTGKVKTTIIRYMLKSVNTPMQKNNSATC